VTLDLAPRWVFNDYLAVGGRYRVLHEAGTRWREAAPSAGAIALRARGADQTLHEVAIGATWSSIAAWQRGRSRRPVELTYEHSRVLDGRGELVRARSDRLGLAVTARLWGK
jgi:hypothetical protein